MTKQAQEEPEEGLDYERLSSELSKAGMLTQDKMTELMNKQLEAIRKERDAQQAELKGSTNEENEFLMHLQNGGCSDPECLMNKEIKKLENDVFTRGVYYGAKIGGYAAKKGVFID